MLPTELLCKRIIESCGADDPLVRRTEYWILAFRSNQLQHSENREPSIMWGRWLLCCPCTRSDFLEDKKGTISTHALYHDSQI